MDGLAHRPVAARGPGAANLHRPVAAALDVVGRVQQLLSSLAHGEVAGRRLRGRGRAVAGPARDRRMGWPHRRGARTGPPPGSLSPESATASVAAACRPFLIIGCLTGPVRRGCGGAGAVGVGAGVVGVVGAGAGVVGSVSVCGTVDRSGSSFSPQPKPARPRANAASATAPPLARFARGSRFSATIGSLACSCDMGLSRGATAASARGGARRQPPRRPGRIAGRDGLLRWRQRAGP